MIVDAQVHVYERNHAGRPWNVLLPGPSEVPGEQMVAAMDAVGVDRSLLVSMWALYGQDCSYARSVFDHHPDRFRVVAPVETSVPGVAEHVAEWAGQPGAVGIRLINIGDHRFNASDPGVAEAVRECEKASLPICVMCWGRLTVMDELARAYPSVQLVLDHVGLPQPGSPPPPADPFKDLPQVLALAKYPNVTVKLTGMCTLSREPFPFDDLWRPLNQLIDAYGVERCLWGTDWTRAVDILTYQEAVSAFRDHSPLTASESAAVMGENAMRIFGWPAD